MTNRLDCIHYERDFPPHDFLLEIKSYTLFSNTKVNKYESSYFEAGGYKWRLSIYPNEKIDGHRYISLCLAIEKPDASSNQKVKVLASFKLFASIPSTNKYRTVEDATKGRIIEFNEKNTEWGFSKFLSHDAFKKTKNGYLVDDICIFGAEVRVYHQNTNISKETLSMVKRPANQSPLFNLPNFKRSHKHEYLSESFDVGRRKWKLRVCPTGETEHKNKSISIFLQLLDDWKTLRIKRIYVEFKLRIRDESQHHNHKEEIVKDWFCGKYSERGCPSFMSLKQLQEESKRFTKDDILKVEVDFLVMSVIDFSSSPRAMILKPS